MRLLHCLPGGTFELTSFDNDNPPPYAILSHTWTEGQEVTYHEMISGTGSHKTGFDKIRFCSERAAADQLQYFWVDTCSIDKSTSEELGTAINSMFKWYQRASRCYVYLSDVSVLEQVTNASEYLITWADTFRRSRWFRRGWTLQELLAPASVEFFSKEGKRLGSKISLEQEIHEITKIPRSALRGQRLTDFSVEERMSWVAPRETSVKEDRVYCLFGIFGVFLPLIYGEGEEYATKRLRDEIQKRQAGREIDWTNNNYSCKAIPAIMRPSCVLPFRRDPDFIACGTILDKLQEKCSTPSSRVALVGLGGVGKSQLAIEFCYRTADRSPETWVFWVHAGNTARLEQSYRDIANQIQLPGRTDAQANVFELVRNWLRDEKSGKWLLVLDNADDADVFSSLPGPGDQKHLSRYLPPSKYGTIIVTSRSGHAASRLVEDRDTLHVKPMGDVGAQALLRKKLGCEVDIDGIVELAAALEYMPLALVQAASYIHKRGLHYSIKQYLEEFRRSDKRKTSLLNQEAGHLQRDEEAKNSIITTWQISFEHIRSIRRSAAEVLSLMSFFDRQGIPKALLRTRHVPKIMQEGKGANNGGEMADNEEDHGPEDSSDEEFIDDILTLRDYSFISETTDPMMLEMHRLVQLAMQKWLAGRGEDEFWNQQFISTMCKAFPTGEFENWGKCQTLFPHAAIALNRRPRNRESCEEWATLLYNAGWYAWRRGNAHETQTLAMASLEARSRLFGAEGLTTLDSMEMVGLAYQLGGQLEAADELQVQVMEIRKRKLGADHPETLRSMNNLALTYQYQGKLESAEELGLQVMEMNKTKLGADHPDTLACISNLASIYWKQERWEAAEPLQVQVMEIWMKKLGVDHPDTLISMGNLAFTWKRQGRDVEALALMRQCVQQRSSKLGIMHPETISSLAVLDAWESQQDKPNSSKQ